MKTLAARTDANEIERRFELVTRQDQPRWGAMNPGHMVCHLRDAYAVGLRTIPVKMVKMPVPRPLLRWLALDVPLRWGKGMKTVPELEFGNGAPAPLAFLTDKASLIDTYWQFVAANHDWPAHPFFGPIKREHWLRWGYLHADHHLRQFGR